MKTKKTKNKITVKKNTTKKLKFDKLKETIVKSFKELLLSFKEKKIIWAFIYDAVFILIAGIILKTASQILMGRINALGISQTATPELMVQNMAVMKQFMYTATVTAIIVYIILILVYTISRGLIWAKIMDRQLTKKYLLKFGLLSLIWITGWIAVFSVIVTISNQQYYKWIMIVLGISYLHLTTILHHSFTYKNTIGSAVQKAFAIGIGKINKLILPYIYIIIIFIVVGQIMNIPTRMTYGITATQTIGVIGIVVLLLFAAWYRTYINKKIKQIETA